MTTENDLLNRKLFDDLDRNTFEVNPKWTRKFPDPSKTLVLKLQTPISPKLFKSDKRFIARSEDNRCFLIEF